jgi:hypothetical protein
MKVTLLTKYFLPITHSPFPTHHSPLPIPHYFKCKKQYKIYDDKFDTNLLRIVTALVIQRNISYGKLT